MASGKASLIEIHMTFYSGNDITPILVALRYYILLIRFIMPFYGLIHVNNCAKIQIKLSRNEKKTYGVYTMLEI